MNTQTLNILRKFAENHFKTIGCYSNDLFFAEEYETEESLCYEIFNDFLEIQTSVLAEKVRYGKSKLVFFFPEIDDYVFKIPFRGIRYYSYCGNADEWEIEYEEDYSFANSVYEEIEDDELWNIADCYSDNDNNDYCGVEAVFYKAAELNHVEDAFAGTWYLCKIDGIPIYVSEKAESCGECFEPYPVGYYDQVKEDENLKYLLDAGLGPTNIYSLVRSYTYAEAIKIADFIINNGITDLHDDNVGKRNGKLVFVDYSGFRE